MAVKDPALEYIEHRLVELADQRKQAQARYDSEYALYFSAVEQIDAEYAAWERLLYPLLTVEVPDEKPAAKKAAAKKADA